LRYRNFVCKTVLTISLGALCTIAVACGDDDAETPVTPTTAGQSTPPSASPTVSTPDGTDCPVDDERICEHAAAIERSLRGGNADAVIGSSTGQPVMCTGGAGQLDPTLPLCEGATPGETRNGMVLGAYQSEATSVTVGGARDAVEEWVAGLDATAADDQYGAAQATVFTIGCDTDDSCESYYAVAVSGIAPGGQRAVLNLIYRPGDTPDLLAIFTGLASLNEALITGGTHEGGLIPAAGETAEYLLLPD
jgi:hypothetical protein